MKSRTTVIAMTMILLALILTITPILSAQMQEGGMMQGWWRLTRCC